MVTHPSPPRETDLTFRDYLRPIVTRWWLILGIVAVVTVGTYVYYERETKVFQTSTRLYTEANDNTNFVLGGGATSFISPRAIQNQATLLTSGLFSQRVARKLGAPPSTLGSVSAAASVDADLITITATSDSGAKAARLANAYAETYIEVRSSEARDALQEGLEKTQEQLERLPNRQSNLQERADLAASVRRIKLALELPGGTTTQLDPAIAPAVAISPKPRRNALFAFALALFGAVALAFGLERFDRRLVRVSDAEAAYGLPLLAVIPHDDEPIAESDGAAGLSPAFQEAFRQMRTNLLLASVDKPIRRVLVASAMPGEGKSTVARNLAIVYREAGDTVAIVDADLRKPTLGKQFGHASERGLTTVLTGVDALGDAILPVPVLAPGLETLDRITTGTRGAVETEGATAHPFVDLLLSGPTPANPQAVLSAERTGEILDELADSHDLLVIDSPPVLAVSDAILLMRRVDAVIIVSRIGVTTRDTAARALETIGKVPEVRLAGIVVNDLSRSGQDAYSYVPEY